MPPDSSYVPDYVSDRGPTEYFHGRVRILANFDKLVEDSMKPRGASTFLIQGAPGAGKTALLYELGKIAEKRDWKVVKIKTSALWDRAKMLRALGIGKWSGISRISMSLLEILETGISFSKPARSSTSMDAVDRSKRKNERLILVMDEAQKLASAKNQPADRLEDAKELLESIHNGELRRPVILLAAGLGPTEEAFSSLGISRFKGGCFVELGALGKESERAVIKDWLIKEGGAKGDPTPWIHQIAKKTHGWPQHISAYGDAAAKQIQSDRGEMTAAGLDVVLRVGAERREAYYRHRAKGISGRGRAILAKLIQNIAPGTGLDEEDIEEFLSMEYNDPDKAKRLFKKAVARGVLHSQDEVYSIPIPSMQTWLISNYARERIETPPIPRSILPPSRDRDLGWER